MQWYGGLGIVILSVAILMDHPVAARRLTPPLDTGETLVVTARTHARHSLLVYLCLTALGFVLIWSISGEGFTSLLHVLSAVSTGGFAPQDNSLAGLNSRPVAIAIIFISFLGAVSLPLYWRISHSGWRQGMRSLSSDIELRTLFIACLIVGTILSGLNWLSGLEAPWYHGLMMGFSAQTTTGFSTQAVSGMDPASKLVMIIAMLIGGSVGSSAGGIKVLRLLILLRLLQLILRRTGLTPHGVIIPTLGGNRLEDEDIIRALQLFALFILMILFSWLSFVLMGYDPLDSLFEVVSACGTVGLSTGITRPELEPFLKAVLCFDMLAGRLEIIALLVILYPRNWLGRREKS
jgi:trk system potassium uptake protein TrkH